MSPKNIEFVRYAIHAQSHSPITALSSKLSSYGHLVATLRFLLRVIALRRFTFSRNNQNQNLSQAVQEPRIVVLLIPLTCHMQRRQRGKMGGVGRINQKTTHFEKTLRLQVFLPGLRRRIEHRCATANAVDAEIKAAWQRTLCDARSHSTHHHSLPHTVVSSGSESNPSSSGLVGSLVRLDSNPYFCLYSSRVSSRAVLLQEYCTH